MTLFAPYPNYPADADRLAEVRRQLEALPAGFSFFDALERDPEMAAVFKTDTVRRALESNATKPEREKRPESEVIAHEEWVFTSFAGI